MFLLNLLSSSSVCSSRSNMPWRRPRSSCWRGRWDFCLDRLKPNTHFRVSPTPHWPPTPPPPSPSPSLPRCSHLQLAHAEQDKLRWRMERAQLEQNIRDSKERMEKLEGYWMEAQSLCKVTSRRGRRTDNDREVNALMRTTGHWLSLCVCVFTGSRWTPKGNPGSVPNPGEEIQQGQKTD